jgi:hypothetical protein
MRMLRRSLVLALSAGALLPAVVAGPAHADSYRRADVEKAVEAAFRSVHGGGPADATCSATSRNQRWGCRLKRPSTRASTRFTLTVAAGGRWSTTSFRFPGFSGKHTLRGCCLRAR